MEEDKADTPEAVVEEQQDVSAEEEVSPEEETSVVEENKEEAPVKDTAFEKMVAVDNDECSITINEIIEEDMFGFYTLKATLENKSAEKTYMFSVDSGYVNGVNSDPFFATEVNPEKKQTWIFPSIALY